LYGMKTHKRRGELLAVTLRGIIKVLRN